MKASLRKEKLRVACGSQSGLCSLAGYRSLWVPLISSYWPI